MSARTAGTIVVSASLALSVPLIAAWEGKSNDPYRDIVGVWTVCYGETNTEMKTYTDEECQAMLRDSVSLYRDRAVSCVPSLATRPYQLAAATSLSYNIGSAGFCRSTAAKRFNAGDYKGGCEAFRRWNKAGGREIRGLTNRREAEVTVCLTGL